MEGDSSGRTIGKLLKGSEDIHLFSLVMATFHAMQVDKPTDIIQGIFC